MNDLFIQGLTIDWNRVRPYNYVRQIPAISGIDTFTFHKPITFFVGENGSGKSTLLEAIAVAYGFNAEGGTKNYSFSTYNSHSELCEVRTGHISGIGTAGMRNIGALCYHCCRNGKPRRVVVFVPCAEI